MIWNENSRLYHRLISNKEDYEKYKSRVSELPEVSEINFDENFIVIIANENIRQMHEKDLTIYNVNADENTTHIIKRKIDVTQFSFNTIVDKNLQHICKLILTFIKYFVNS